MNSRVVACRSRAIQLVFIALASITTDAQDKARDLVEDAQQRTRATSMRYEGLLRSFDANKKTSEKRWTFERIGSHGSSKAVIRFTAPAEVKGVALLVVNHPARASDQWMWTPALERDRRVALQDRSTRFFGTDFSFEDLEERDVGQYDYTLLEDENVDGNACWRIQTTPKTSKGSQYTRSILWLRKDNYASVRLESYVGVQLARRLAYSRITNVHGIWTALEMVMSDLRRGTTTTLVLEKVEYNMPVREEDFTLAGLRRR
jgi:Outer membrane lipoprotein-sorting protein